MCLGVLSNKKKIEIKAISRTCRHLKIFDKADQTKWRFRQLYLPTADCISIRNEDKLGY